MKNFKTYTLCILILSILNVLAINAQPNRKTASLVSQYVEAAKNNTEKPDLAKLFNSPKKHVDIILSAQMHYNDTTLKGVVAAYSLSYRVALKSSVSSTRQLAVDHISEGINHNHRSVAAWCVGHLSVFNRTDFSPQAQQNISANLQQGTPKLGELIKVAGYLNLSDQQAQLESLAASLKKVGDKWACWLALSRMDNNIYTSRVCETVRRQGVNDDVVYELVPDLVYTRQKEAFDVALAILFDDKKKCISSTPDSPRPIQCGYRVMEYLAPIIQDFPYAVKTSGDLDTQNYEEALTEIRKWFLEQGDSYEILDNTF